MPGSRWKRRLVALGTERLGYKAAALFFAVVLWIAASGEEPAARAVPLRFSPALDSSVRMLGSAPTMRALVAGPAREVLKLYASPPTLRHAFGPETPGSVQLDLTTADVDLPPGVRDVIVRAVQPNAVALRFEALAERRVPVRMAVRAEQGLIPENSDLVADPDTVVVRGPRGRVDHVRDVPTTSRALGPADTLGFVTLDTTGLGVTTRPSIVRLVLRARGVAPAAAATVDSIPFPAVTRPITP